MDCRKIKRAVLDWIRDDLPLSAKMILQPEDVDALVERICAPPPPTEKE